MLTIVQIAALLIFIAVFVISYYTTKKELVAYTVKCAAYFALLLYLIKQMF